LSPAVPKTPIPNATLLACPSCRTTLRFFESFPAQSGLPQVDVFTCDVCESMILQDRTSLSVAPGAKLAP